MTDLPLLQTSLHIGYLPSTSSQFENRIFRSTPNDDGRVEPFVRLRQHLEHMGHVLETADDLQGHYDVLIVHRIDVNAGRLLKLINANADIRLIYLVTEEEVICPLHDPALLDVFDFDAVLSWNPVAVAQGAVSYSYPNPTLIYSAGQAFQNRELLVAVAANKAARPFARGELYTYRRRLFESLALDDQFSLFGPGWSQKGLRNSYKGMAETKSSVLQKFRFNLIIENSRELGGVTEKIFDSMANGCVPVYFGAPDIAGWIPKECYIELDKLGANNLCAKLARVTEAEWQQYRDAIETFLASPRYERFAEKGFVAAAQSALDVAIKKNHSRKYWGTLGKFAQIVVRKPSIWFYRGGQKYIADLALAAVASRPWPQK